jgi:hypothetical protein
VLNAWGSVVAVDRRSFYISIIGLDYMFGPGSAGSPSDVSFSIAFYKSRGFSLFFKKIAFLFEVI